MEFKEYAFMKEECLKNVGYTENFLKRKVKQKIKDEGYSPDDFEFKYETKEASEDTPQSKLEDFDIIVYCTAIKKD